MKLILFDIDGTLVETGGTGMRAFAEALRELFGIENGLRGISLDGKTDPLILQEALNEHGILDSPSKFELERFVFRYVVILKEELATNFSAYQVLPKVPDLLTALKQQPDIVLGLATGNVEEGALAKLEPGNLNHFFLCGGYGSDSESRTELIKMAIERAEILMETDYEQVLVVGDTPNDITHGRRAGAETIGVSTGRYSTEQLAEYRPGLLLESFDPIDNVLQFVNTSRMAGLQ